MLAFRLAAQFDVSGGWLSTMACLIRFSGWVGYSALLVALAGSGCNSTAVEGSADGGTVAAGDDDMPAHCGVAPEPMPFPTNDADDAAPSPAGSGAAGPSPSGDGNGSGASGGDSNGSGANGTGAGSGSGGSSGAAGSSGGGGSGGNDAGCPVSNEPLRLRFEPLALVPEVTRITDFVFVPGREEVLVGSKDGTISHLSLAGDETQLLGQFVMPDVYDDLDCGLISLAFDPGFETNGFLYAGYCVTIQGSGIYRFHFDPNDYDGVAETVAEIVLVEGEPVTPANERPWHNVGSLSFDAEGTLWAPFGDKVRREVAQDTTNAMGSLLSIVPNRDPDGSGYEPGPNNPFAVDSGNDSAIYAWGLRSPWHGTLDHAGRFWFGDVGSNRFEEINLVTAAGQNFGWPRSEGPCQAESETCQQEIDPLTYWDRELDHVYVLDDPEADPLGARVGYVAVEYVARSNDRYSGRLHHRVIYGDYCVGWVRAIGVDQLGNVVHDEYIGHVNNPSAWRQGPDGYLYVSTFGRCQSDGANATDAPSQLLRAVAAP